MKPATSSLACSWGLPFNCQGPSYNPTRRKSGCGPGLGELLEIWGFPFNISATAGASDFRLCIPLGLAKAHYKITPRGKSRRSPGLGSSPKFEGSRLIFLQLLKLATSNLVHSLGLPRPVIKSHPKEKSAWPWLGSSPKLWGSATAEATDFKFDAQLGFVKDHHKITRRRKKGGVILD